MISLSDQLRKMFVLVATKVVAHTDVSKGAYVVNKPQRAVLEKANIKPGTVPESTLFPLYIIDSDEVLQASYYGSVRTGSGRAPEYRMGRFTRWLKAGDNLLMATDGRRVFVYKVRAEDFHPPKDRAKYEEKIRKVYAQLGNDTLVRMAEPKDDESEQRGGQGFKDNKEERKAIEAHAMHLAMNHLIRKGYEVEDVHSRRSYDLLAARSHERLYVEVKGTILAGYDILVTPSEVDFARRHAPAMALIIVSHINVSHDQQKGVSARGGKLKYIQPWKIIDECLTPTGYSYSIKRHEALSKE